MTNHVIHRRESLAENIHEFWVHAPLVARKHRAGQFVIVRLHDRSERVPLTVVSTDSEKGLIRLMVQEAGKSTCEMAQLKAGDHFRDIVGPLGKPTHIQNWGSLIAIGGGVGCAPLLPIVKAARAAGNSVYGIIGARSHSLLILENEFKEICHRLRVCTDDGSYGEKGLVTDVLRNWVQEGFRFNQAVVIGPVVMMHAVADLTKDLGIPALASLNPIMVDGTGMCGACRVTVNGETKFACVDGPEFDAHGVDFRELALRNRAYREQELRAMEIHECKIGLPLRS